WERSADAPSRLSDGEPRRRHPVLPLDVGQGARNGAVRWQPDRDRDIAVFAIAPGDMAQTIGRIRQPMQEYHRSDRCSVGLEHIGAIPVLRKAFRIDGTTLEIAIDRN